MTVTDEPKARSLLWIVGRGALLGLMFIVAAGLIGAVGMNFGEEYSTYVGIVVVAFGLLTILVPTFLVIAIIYDLLRVFISKDPLFYYKTWFRVFCAAVIWIMLIVTLSLWAGQSEKAAFNSTPAAVFELTAAYAASTEDIASNEKVDLTKVKAVREEFRFLLVVSIYTVLFCLVISFMMSLGVVILVEETEHNKKRIGMASDLVKMIGGLFVGVFGSIFKDIALM